MHSNFFQPSFVAWISLAAATTMPWTRFALRIPCARCVASKVSKALSFAKSSCVLLNLCCAPPFLFNPLPAGSMIEFDGVRLWKSQWNWDSLKGWGRQAICFKHIEYQRVQNMKVPGKYKSSYKFQVQMYSQDLKYISCTPSSKMESWLSTCTFKKHCCDITMIYWQTKNKYSTKMFWTHLPIQFFLIAQRTDVLHMSWQKTLI